MSLTVKVGKKSEEMDNLSEDEVVENEVVDNNDRLRQLEIENAEQRGRLSVLQKSAAPGMNHEQVKLSVFQDANNLSDEAFQDKYKMAKHMATASVLERENAMTKAETKQELAEARASSELSARYGSDYFKYKDQIEDTLNDLSPEVRQDPKRLAKHMERTFKAISSEHTPKKKSLSAEEERKRLVPDFEKPTPGNDGRQDKEEIEDKDEIEEQFRPLAKAIGLTSEKERLQYKTIVDNGEFVPMELGGGVRFSDPAKGFERVEAKR